MRNRWFWSSFCCPPVAFTADVSENPECTTRTYRSDFALQKKSHATTTGRRQASCRKISEIKFFISYASWHENVMYGISIHREINLTVKSIRIFNYVQRNENFSQYNRTNRSLNSSKQISSIHLNETSILFNTKSINKWIFKNLCFSLLCCKE